MTDGFIRRVIKEEMRAEAARLEDQAQTFIRMGYKINELTMVQTGHWTKTGTEAREQRNIVPKSALEYARK